MHHFDAEAGVLSPFREKKKERKHIERKTISTDRFERTNELIRAGRRRLTSIEL
jgi:hypothetical protein